MKVRIKPGGWAAILIAAGITGWSYRSVIVATASSATAAVATVSHASMAKGFGQITPTDPALATAIHATALDQADKLIDKDGAFTGQVYKVFTPPSGTIHILNFDAKYNQAISAVVDDKDVKSFPSLETLVGQRVLVRGTFMDFNGHPEMKVTSPSQIALVSVEQANTKVAAR